MSSQLYTRAITEKGRPGLDAPAASPLGLLPSDPVTSHAFERRTPWTETLEHQSLAVAPHDAPHLDRPTIARVRPAYESWVIGATVVMSFPEAGRRQTRPVRRHRLRSRTAYARRTSRRRTTAR